MSRACRGGVKLLKGHASIAFHYVSIITTNVVVLLVLVLVEEIPH